VIDRNLAPCPGCRRHVADEAACPFCGIALAPQRPSRAVAPGRLSRAAVFAGATLTGCWTNSNQPVTTPIEHHDTAQDKADKTEGSKVDASEHHEFARSAAKTGRIEGTLTETSTNQPQDGQQVALVNNATHARLVVTTDPAGHYMFDNVEPGDYTLVWDETGNPRRPSRRVSAHVADGAQVKLDITITWQPQQQQHHNNIPMPYGAPPARRRVV